MSDNRRNFHGRAVHERIVTTCLSAALLDQASGATSTTLNLLGMGSRDTFTVFYPFAGSHVHHG
jgi:hypothetical protein